MLDTTRLDEHAPPEPAGAVHCGTVTLIVGCMFSGKTTELVRHLSTCPPESAAAFKHVIDIRYRADAIVTHGGVSVPAIVVAAAADIPARVPTGATLVAIDEAHFFDDGIAGVVAALTHGGIEVVLTGLDLDSWGRPFPVVEQLRALASATAVLHATCARCGRAADHTQRRTAIGEGGMVGGPEDYEPRCRSCWIPPPEPPPT